MATVEHAALVVVVSSALAAGGTAADAERVPRAVAAQVEKAFCLVAGGDCLAPGGPRACVVRRDARSRVRELSAAVFRLRDGRSVLLEHRSDGTVRVTVGLSNAAGATAVLGARFLVGGRGVSAAGEVGGGGEAAWLRRYVVADAAAARRLVERLEEHDPPVGGGAAGVVRFLAGGSGDEHERAIAFAGEAQAEAALRALGLGGVARAARRVAAGVRVDRSGARTLLLALDREVTASLAAPLTGLGMGLSSTRDVELELGRDGRPAMLTVRATGAVRGDAKAGGWSSDGGDLVEGEARLDLADPRVRALAGRLLGGDADAGSDLAAELRRGARLDARVYATGRDSRTSGGTVAVGGQLGLETTTTTESARLVGAWGREPGAGWTQRLDCGVL
jgi:hypothetical protein